MNILTKLRIREKAAVKLRIEQNSRLLNNALRDALRKLKNEDLNERQIQPKA